MALKCENPTIELLQPRSGIQFLEGGGSSTPPFQMKGAPMGIKNPEPLKGVSEWVRKKDASMSQNPKEYFAKGNYREIQLQTENILGADTDTTLRYEGETFRHAFTAIHKSVWNNPWLEVSLFFTNDDNHFLHICVPIEFTKDGKHENQYLKKWLTKDASIPNGLTTNDLLHFRGDDRVRCAVLHYCLEFNEGKIKKPYIFCYFENKLQVQEANLQPWITDMKNFNPPSENQHIVFDEILCLVLRGTFSKYVLDMPDPYVISDERFFNSKRKQDNVQPTYYNLPLNSFGNKVQAKTTEGFQSTRLLGNVKCYPIDLATQVDDQGRITIDEATNKPIDPKQATEAGSEFDLDGSADADVDDNQHTIAYWIFFIVFGVLLLAFVAVLVVFTLRGKSVVAPPAPPTVNRLVPF